MRRILALSFPILLALLLVSRGAEWLSEKWWFGALDQSATWWTYMKWRGAAFFIAAPLWMAIVGSNLRLAWRQALALREPLSLLGGSMEGVTVRLSPALRLGRLIARVTVWTSAWLAGLAAANRFDLWLLFAGGRADSSNLEFFLFRLPALDWFVGWLGVAFGLTFVACLTLYFWLEAIETGPGVLRASESARAHLSLLGALLVAWKGMDCGLNVIGAPIVFGDSINGILGVPERLAGVPASQFFAWSALPVAVLVFWLGARDNGRRALALSVGWLCLAITIPAIAPSFARSIGVGDDATQQQFVAEHLDATRRAWGFDATQDLEIAEKAPFTDTVLPAPGRRAPVALWPLDGASSALADRLQTEPQPALRAARLHIARASDKKADDSNDDSNDGLQLRAILTQRDSIGEAPARELQAPLDQAGPLQWQTPRALDSILISEAPPTPEAQTNRLGQPPVNDTEPFEPLPRYRLTTQPQFAVERASLGACLTLAWRFFDFSLVRPGPPLMWHLSPVERAQNLAPFVNWSGAIAHPVTLESGVGPHVYWLVEGCLTARTYPNSATLPGGEGWGGVNYSRQNVTAVFDGTTGKSQLYLFNRNEPISRLWNRALPGLFRPIEEMPAPLRVAIKASPAQLNAMTRIYARYHPTKGDEALQWATRQNEWRPILATEQAPTPYWNDALLPDSQGDVPQGANSQTANSQTANAQGGLTQWQISAFAPSRGRVETGAGVASLTGIVGVTLHRDGSWRWRQWRPTKPLALPAFATPPLYSYNSETGPRFAPPTRVGVFPAFDEAGRADGFTAFRAEVQIGTDKAPSTLRVQAATTGALAAGPQQIAPLANSLVRARELWSEILLARRNGDWPLVAQLETQLSRALGTTIAAPTPTPAPMLTPAPTAKVE